MIYCNNAFSQPGDPGGDPDGPISGIGLLLAAGAFLGIKNLNDLKKRQ